MKKTLDEKISRILADSSVGDFILADAKDGDMGGGISSPGQNRGSDSDRHPYRTHQEYMQYMRDVTQQGLVDIMLMSVSSSEQLTIKERFFDNSAVTPAIRANDTTDIWLGSSGGYANQPSLPFRSTTIDHAQCGKWQCTAEERTTGVDLGLYSITFNNDTELDRAGLQAYKDFRIEAEQKGFRHFLEVFVPNAPGKNAPENVADYVNDTIAKTLAGVTTTISPFKAPIEQQITKVIRIAIQIGHSRTTPNTAIIMPAKPIIDPTERSNSPAIISKQAPTAIIMN